MAVNHQVVGSIPTMPATSSLIATAVAVYSPLPVVRIVQKISHRRGVAQSGSALALGARCRGFESLRPDHSITTCKGNYHVPIWLEVKQIVSTIKGILKQITSNSIERNIIEYLKAIKIAKDSDVIINAPDLDLIASTAGDIRSEYPDYYKNSDFLGLLILISIVINIYTTYPNLKESKIFWYIGGLFVCYLLITRGISALIKVRRQTRQLIW